MKTFAVVALKGGVGKTALSVMLAQYAALKKDSRVLFIDTDGQGNSSHTLRVGGHATISEIHSSRIFTDPGLTVESSNFIALPADTAGLRVLEQQRDQRNAFATNFRNNIAALSDQFDLCIIDTAPSTDIRLLSVLVSADAVISPLELNQEAVSGMGLLMNDPQTGVVAIKNKLNPELEFLGFLPNKVAHTNFQTANLELVVETAGQFIFKSTSGQPLKIKHSTAVAESMASGDPIFNNIIKSTTWDTAWKSMKPVFDEILNRVFITEASNNGND